MQRSNITGIFFSLVLLAAFCSPLYSQYITVSYELEKNYFNEGQPLPAEKNLMFTGQVPQSADIIEISIFPSKVKKEEDLLYVASWKDFDQDANTNFTLAVNFPLRASEKYDFRIDYYRQITRVEQQELSRQIVTQLTDYLNANITREGNGFKLSKSKNRMIREMETILANSLDNYRSQNDINQIQFSPTIEQQLDQIQDLKLALAAKDSTSATEQAPQNPIEALKTVLANDIKELMSAPWSKQFLSRYVDDYETERKKGFFALNVGYGGVYLDGKLDDFSYGTAPYAGVALPLGNSTFAPKFLRNSSIVMGAFFENFEDEAGNEVTGFIINRPIYAGLDYRLFEFVHFNAGAAFLEKTKANTTGDGQKQENFIRPFLGLSARINLSVGFGK